MSQVHVDTNKRKHKWSNIGGAHHKWVWNKVEEHETNQRDHIWQEQEKMWTSKISKVWTVEWEQDTKVQNGGTRTRYKVQNGGTGNGTKVQKSKTGERETRCKLLPEFARRCGEKSRPEILEMVLELLGSNTLTPPIDLHTCGSIKVDEPPWVLPRTSSPSLPNPN